MTRREPRAQRPAEPASASSSGHASPSPSRGSRPLAAIAFQAALLAAVFLAGTGLALLAGAANTGTAMGVGQIAFTVVLVWLLLRR